MRRVYLWLLLWTMSYAAAAGGEARMKLVRVAVRRWEGSRPPFPLMRARFAQADRPAGTWRRLSAVYRCAGTEPVLGPVRVEFYVLVRSRRYGRLVLEGARENTELHEPGRRYRAWLFLGPEAEEMLGAFRIQGLCVRLICDGREADRRVRPRRLRRRLPSERYPLVQGLLVDHLASPWAHLTDDGVGGLKPRVRPAVDAEPPARFLRYLKQLSESAAWRSGR